MSLARRLKPSHLNLVVKIAETGKLQSAAAALAMSQPAASRLLSEIEAQAGTALFERHAKGMVPTPVGAAFVHHAQSILYGYDSLATEVADLKTGRGGKVRIGSVTGPAAGALIAAIRQVRASAPDIEVTIEVAPSMALVRGLEEGKFDFVIGRLPPDADSAAFRIFPARNELVALLVSQDHPMAGRRQVGLRDLTGFEWVIQERGSPIRRAVEGAFLSAGIQMPATITNSSSLLVALALLEKSAAIAPQSREVADLLSGEGLKARVAVLELEQPIFVAPFFLIQLADRTLPRISEIVSEAFLRAI